MVFLAQPCGLAVLRMYWLVVGLSEERSILAEPPSRPIGASLAQPRVRERGVHRVVEDLDALLSIGGLAPVKMLREDRQCTCSSRYL